MKRPTLKSPEVKPPALLVDLYHDLRDRRLLLPLALVAVAIAATPILLGRGSEPKLPAAAEGAISALKEESRRSTSTLTVVEAKPGLRDYRKRLRRRTPTDPFKQRYTAPVLKGAELPEEESGGGGGGGSGEEQSSGGSAGGENGGGSSKGTTGGAPSGGGGGSEGNGSGGADGGSGGGKGHVVLYSFAVNLQIVHVSGSDADGDKKVSEPQMRKNVLPPAALPGPKTPVVTYMGLSPKSRQPLFLVSNDVTGTFGEGKCVSGTDGCQLIELEPGFPQTFEYGEDGDRYKLKVTHVELVVKGRV